PIRTPVRICEDAAMSVPASAFGRHHRRAVQIERARSPAPFEGAVAAEFCFYLLEHEQQRVGIEAGFDLDTGVDEIRLLFLTPRRGGIVGGACQKSCLRHATDVCDRLSERR